MNPEEQLIAIAKVCGWTRFTPDTIQYTARRSDGKWDMIPDYLNDLNAMHEAELNMSDGEHDAFQQFLLEIVSPKTHWSDMAQTRIVSATAAQRAEAFLKTMLLWKP